MKFVPILAYPDFVTVLSANNVLVDCYFVESFVNGLWAVIAFPFLIIVSALYLIILFSISGFLIALDQLFKLCSCLFNVELEI